MQKYVHPATTILYTMRTNRTLINDEWSAYFKEHNFLVGISLDGLCEMHGAWQSTRGPRPATRK